MALGVAANTIGKVIASTVFMCVCSTFRPSDFLLFVKNGFVVGVRCQGNSESLKECEYPHCASATRRLALDNRTYSAQLANSTHTRCRPTLSWMGGGAVAEWLERREVGEGGREGGEGGRGGREGGREGAPVKEGRVKGRVDEGNERGKDRTRHGRREGKRGRRK